ncbi:YHS domain-containing (seleno)protein [Fulvivirgaceae bacterium BMA12]|uniref:YHS domain-containing (Seleno)protein n=1 Tax=Agaribacillus aureus TaxID=3051825 RepID=A0ABT8L9H2_9BACT|nr:YHS domain-containing (seleno)protein [Fulvivirgaceae bacterium BMA12]
MKAIIISAILFLFAMTVNGQSLKTRYNVDDSKIALQGYSPVSYVDLGLAQKGSKQFVSTHKEVKYYFTDAKQKSRFEANPDKYLPQYGGYCAFGVYAGAKFRTDPNKFLVKNGKLYLFLYDVELDAKQLWLAENNDPKLIKTANTNWAKLKNTY